MSADCNIQKSTDAINVASIGYKEPQEFALQMGSSGASNAPWENFAYDRVMAELKTKDSGLSSNCSRPSTEFGMMTKEYQNIF